MDLIYIAAAYRDERGAYYIQRNIERARDFMLWLLYQDFAVHCPHMNTALLDGACPDSTFLENDLEILCRCDDVYVLVPGIGPVTDDFTDELQMAHHRKIPVRFFKKSGSGFARI